MPPTWSIGEYHTNKYCTLAEQLPLQPHFHLPLTHSSVAIFILTTACTVHDKTDVPHSCAVLNLKHTNQCH